MRHGSSNNRRSRNRGGAAPRKGNNQKTQVFDSNGPDVRIRGTAFQVSEKYVALAKDAQGAGDMVLYQSYLQHAEHYQRMINTWEAENQSYDNSDSGNESGNETNSAQSESKPAAKRAPKGNEADDLGLPSSIIGESARDSELEIS
jgi:hypothetical protein